MQDIFFHDRRKFHDCIRPNISLITENSEDKEKCQVLTINKVADSVIPNYKIEAK
jgi:hypothetical protein